jgi:FkbM family methyltransferase
MNSLKRTLLNLANTVIAPAGVSLYRKGADMESVLRRMSGWNPAFGTVLDMGAAKGNWSKQALDLFPGAQVIGVDPLQEREPFLAKLKAAYPSRYDYVMAVAGPSDGGEAELAVTADLDGSTVDGSEGSKRIVPVISVDGMVARMGLKGPFFLKFDTHGFERPILDGSEETLKQTKYIVMEAYNYRHTAQTMLFHEMIAHLETKGFRVFNLVDILQRPHDGALWQIDLFFARADDPVFASDSYRHA